MGITALSTVFFKMSHQFINGACLIEFSVIITLEHLQKGPLCPLVIDWVASAHFTVPIIAETYLIQLLTVAGNILVGGDFGMLSRLNGILLGRQTISIIAHGMQHIEAFQTLVTCINVTGNITQGMSHMQTRSRRIREHIEYIELRTVIIYFTFVGVMFTPILLPLFLYIFIVIVHFLYIVLI